MRERVVTTSPCNRTPNRVILYFSQNQLAKEQDSTLVFSKAHIENCIDTNVFDCISSAS
jgi:hypothetical protein